MYCPNCKIDYLEGSNCTICGRKLEGTWVFLTLATEEELDILLDILISENIPYKTEHTRIFVPENYLSKAMLVISYDNPKRFDWLKTAAYLALVALILGIIL